MSKEYLEALSKIKTVIKHEMCGLVLQGSKDSRDYINFEKSLNDLSIIEQALQQLESINNTIEICKKANEQKYVYIKETYGIIKEKFFDDLDYEFFNNRLYVCSRGMYYDFPLKDYGNWWTLTKEELKE